ncbi:co-chaperone GroES [Vibrio europaeus]|uniref:co-chaperone GroES n=1 Tax=Vibrio oreintalis group TaxID=1891919 RepID=UPI00398F46A2
MNSRPFNDRLIVERLEAQHLSERGIVLTLQPVQKSNREKVVAVGLDQRLENGERVAMAVTVNDVVILNKGYEVKAEKWTLQSRSSFLSLMGYPDVPWRLSR